MNSLSQEITVITVNWYSAHHLVRLFENLVEKATQPELLRFLVMDNTRGQDTKLKSGIDDFRRSLYQHRDRHLDDHEQELQIDVYVTDGPDLSGSHAHAQALDQAIPLIKTRWILILDPDVHVFAEDWDSVLLKTLETVAFAGAPYPFWKLGKYHDFPSPVFLFAATEKLRKLNQPWTPFALNPFTRSWHFLARQVVRLGFLANRRRVTGNGLISVLGRKLEQFFGVCGPDTGWLLAREAGNKQMDAALFTPMTRPLEPSSGSLSDQPSYSPSKEQLSEAVVEALNELIVQYEGYCFQNELFMTHKYGTGSMVWRTPKGHDTEYWLNLVDRIEAGL